MISEELVTHSFPCLEMEKFSIAISNICASSTASTRRFINYNGVFLVPNVENKFKIS